MIKFYVSGSTRARQFFPSKYARKSVGARDFKANPFKAMPPLITVERVETKQTLIEVAAKSPEEAFSEVKAGQGHELGTVKNSELLIRDSGKPKKSHH